MSIPETITARLADFRQRVHLDAVPVRIRAAAYSLPLFVLWIVPLSWETAERLVQSGRRALALFLLYGASIGVTYLFSGLLQLFIQPNAALSLIWFILRTLFGALYVVISVILAVQEYRAGDATDAQDAAVTGFGIARFLERGANRFERLVSQ